MSTKQYRLTFICRSLLVSTALVACQLMSMSVATAMPHLGGVVEPATGQWRGMIKTPNGDIPFKFVLQKNEGDFAAVVDLAGYGYFDIRPATKVTNDGLELDFSVYRSSVRISLTGSSDFQRGTWTAEGETFDVTAYYDGQFQERFTREDIVFKNGDVTIAGTLLRPVGTGPFPVVVWTHGSGPVTRDNPVYRGPAFWLAENGIASLIYDKRGAGKSTGSHDRDPYYDLVDDAIAGIQVLKKRDDIDPERIGVGGMSQGGWLAPYAASHSDEVRFCVALSAPGISPPDQNIFNQHNALLRAGFTDDEAATASKILAAAYDHAKTGKGRAEALRGLEFAKSQRWYDAAWEIAYFDKVPLPQGPITNPFLEFVPEEIWRGVKVPVVAIWGELDTALPAQVSLRVVREALDDIGNKNRTLLVLPGTGHDLRLQANSVWAPWHPGNRAIIDFIHALDDEERPSLPPGMEK